MEKHTFTIPNISCGHCVAAIQNELKLLDGILKVEGNPNEKKIEVEFDAPATIESITKTLAEINYPAK